MVQRLDMLKETPSQTAGPYVHIGCVPNFAEIEGVFPTDLGASMKTGPVAGTEVTVFGRVFDGTGTPLRDAMIEIWQADGAGIFPGRDNADPNFTGFGRSAGDAETGRMYFEDEPEANAADPILSRVEHQVRVPTLLAKAQGKGRYLFDIHLQGPQETIFFDI